ncbi:unnamed protein product [Lampetra planeri]
MATENHSLTALSAKCVPGTRVDARLAFAPPRVGSSLRACRVSAWAGGTRVPGTHVRALRVLGSAFRRKDGSPPGPQPAWDRVALGLSSARAAQQHRGTRAGGSAAAGWERGERPSIPPPSTAARYACGRQCQQTFTKSPQHHLRTLLTPLWLTGAVTFITGPRGVHHAEGTEPAASAPSAAHFSPERDDDATEEPPAALAAGFVQSFAAPTEQLAMPWPLLPMGGRL